MAAEIRKSLGLDAELIRGSGGIFDVIVDGATIYSKHQTGQFPAEHVIVDTIRKRKA